MGCIDNSIRATLIVSDEAGFNVVKELFYGFNLNHTIQNIVIYDEANTPETETLYVEEHEVQSATYKDLKKITLKRFCDFDTLKSELKKLVLDATAPDPKKGDLNKYEKEKRKFSNKKGEEYDTHDYRTTTEHYS